MSFYYQLTSSWEKESTMTPLSISIATGWERFMFKIEEPGRLESTGLHTVGHDLATEQQQQKFTRKKIVKTYKIQASVFIIRVSIHKIIFVKLL